jgi:hypothetical protein
MAAPIAAIVRGRRSARSSFSRIHARRSAIEMRANSEGWSWKPPPILSHDFAPAIRLPKIGSRRSTRSVNP